MGEFVEKVFRALMVGLVTGTIYGLIGLGVVLIFKAQRVINFAQAEIATFAAFMLFLFTSVLGWAYVPSALAAVSAAVLLSIIVERLVYRPLKDAPDVTVFVATAGVALLLIALTLLIAGANILIVQPLSPELEARFGANPILGLVSPQRLLVLGVLVVSAGLLALFFSRTALGKAVLAMSAEPFAVRLAGINPDRISLLVWGIAGLLAGMAGVAFVPTTALTPGLFTTLALIPALTAVVIGGLTSLPGALVGGLAVGFLSELAATFAPASVPGPNIIAAFVILLLTLLFRPQGLLVRGT
ncbi:MAG: branched-chain amino acid ABC transporter permease [Dehalococcoidia bacterium]